MLSKPWVIFCFALLLSLLCSVRAALVNSTIDDFYGDERGAPTDLTFYPPLSEDGWNDELCDECFLRPDPERAHRGTWKEATYFPDSGPVSLQIGFEGVS